MSYLHGNVSTSRPRFDDLQNTALGSLPMLQRKEAQKLFRLTPQQRKNYAIALRRAVADMTPDQKRLYDDLMHRQRIEGGYTPGQLGINWGTVGTVVGGILEAGAAVGGVYLAYEGMQDAKDARKADRKLAEQRLEQESRALDQQIRERNAALEREQREWEMRQAQMQQDGASQDQMLTNQAGVQKPGMDTKTKMMIGGGAAVAAVALTQL